MSNDVVSIKTLKTFVYENLPASSPLRDLILAEPERMPVQEFIIKTGIWLRLMRRIKN